MGRSGTSSTPTFGAVKQPNEKWAAVFGGVSECCARKVAAAVADWVVQLPPEQRRFGCIFAPDSLATKDPPAATAWVAKLPDCDARNDASAVVARTWSRKAPLDKDKIIE